MKKTGQAFGFLVVVLAVLGVASAGSSQLIRPDAQANSVCKSFKICHNSKGLAWTSMSVFQALEPLFDELKLSPMNDYVEINELPSASSVKEGCSCSTPVEVQLSLPIAPGGATDVLLGLVDRFMQERLVTLLKDVVCVSPLVTVPCRAPTEAVVVQRRRLSEEDTIVEATTVDDPNALATSTTTPYDWTTEEDAPAPVPDVQTLMLESAGPVSTTSSSEAGGYYAAPEAGGYYAPTPEAGGYYAPTPEAGGYYGSSETEGEERPTSRRLNSEGGFAHAKHNKGHAAPTCPPCPACGEASYLRAAKLAATAGTCYCRYNAATATWALSDAGCKSALYARCGAAGSLLECAHLEAYYSVEAPAAASAIASFLFVDCPPAAPCSCNSLMFDGRVAATPQCCSDLRAHCQVPFAGLSCRAVDAVCAGMASNDVKAFVRVKTHNAVCAANTRPAYTLQRVDAAVQKVAEPSDVSSTLGAGLLGLMFGAGFMAVSMAGVGVMALVQHFVQRQGAAAPLLGDY